MFVHIEQRTLAFEDRELCPHKTTFIQRPRSQTTIKKYYRRPPDCFLCNLWLIQMDIDVWEDIERF